MKIIMSLLVGTIGEANYKTPWTKKTVATFPQPDHDNFVTIVEKTIEQEQPFCVWFGYELDGEQPTPQLCDLVQKTAQQYINDGRLIVLDSRRQNHISV